MKYFRSWNEFVGDLKKPRTWLFLAMIAVLAGISFHSVTGVFAGLKEAADSEISAHSR